MEDNFFAQATNHLCSSLDLIKSLQKYFNYIKQYIPIDGIYMNIYKKQASEIQFIAHVNNEFSKSLDSTFAISHEFVKILEAKDRPVIRIINNIKKDPITFSIAPNVVKGIQSLIMLKMTIENTHLGIMGFYSTSLDNFKQYHADLIKPQLHVLSLITALNLQQRNLLIENKNLSKQNTSLLKAVNCHNVIIGENTGLKSVMKSVHAIAKFSTPVLLLGETGCGKEVIANAIHDLSDRSNGPFVKINCGAIPETLIDSILFGYEKGAFTGADSAKSGYFEQANNGTIFLDEIGELPLQVQVRLLRVLQSDTIMRVGGSIDIPLNIRVIAATHKDLHAMVLSNEFREDLWYRLAVFPITIPNLRDRKDDLPALIHHILEITCAKFKLTRLPIVKPEQIKILTEYNWPGNIRELINVIERAIIQYPKGPLDFGFLQLHITLNQKLKNIDAPNLISEKNYLNCNIIPLNQYIKDYIRKTLNITGGKIYGKEGAAELLNINPETLRSKIKKLEIE